MEICLAPHSSASIGCDNMTVIIIALLNGRTKEEWYAWVKDRVARQYGYDTPEQVPQIFPPRTPSRMQGAVRSNLDEPDGTGLRISAGGLGGLARALSNGPISFHPGVHNDDETLEFERYDSDEEDSDEERGASSSFLNSLRRSKEDVTKYLLARLEEEMEMDHEDQGGQMNSRHLDRDGDMEISEAEADGAAESSSVQPNLGRLENKNLQQGQAPLPPPLDANSGEEPQLTPQPPSGDAPSGAVKVEGLMDTSENPFKTD